MTKQRLRTMKVDEISTVIAGDNPPARVVFMKNAEPIAKCDHMGMKKGTRCKNCGEMVKAQPDGQDAYVKKPIKGFKYDPAKLRQKRGMVKSPHDGDGDGFYSPYRGAPDKTPMPHRAGRRVGRFLRRVDRSAQQDLHFQQNHPNRPSKESRFQPKRVNYQNRPHGDNVDTRSRKMKRRAKEVDALRAQNAATEAMNRKPNTGYQGSPPVGGRDSNWQNKPHVDGQPKRTVGDARGNGEPDAARAGQRGIPARRKAGDEITSENDLRDRKMAAINQLEDQIRQIKNTPGGMSAADQAMVDKLQRQLDSLRRVAKASTLIR